MTCPDASSRQREKNARRIAPAPSFVFRTPTASATPPTRPFFPMIRFLRIHGARRPFVRIIRLLRLPLRESEGGLVTAVDPDTGVGYCADRGGGRTG